MNYPPPRLQGTTRSPHQGLVDGLVTAAAVLAIVLSLLRTTARVPQSVG